MVNKVIRYLILSDFVINFAFGLFSPLFGVFILSNIAGSSLRVIGIATLCYWTARVLSTVPLSRWMDRTDGERDEFYFVIVGSFPVASVPLGWLFVSQPWHLYVVEFIYGLANSMAVPAWRILFTDHLDRGRTGYEWSLEDIAVGLSVGISAYVGSIIADKFGFQVVLIMLAILGYIGTLVLIPIYNDAKTLAQIRREHKLERIKHLREDEVVGDTAVK